MTVIIIILVRNTVNSPVEFSLKNILPLLEDVDNVFPLGIQLGIETSHLRTFENEYRSDLKRQKVEVIDHWLKNSNDPSWETLAKAVKQLGTHNQLASRLSAMGQGDSKQPEAVFSHLSSSKYHPAVWLLL